MDPAVAWMKLTSARFGALGTVDPDHGTHLVPVVFTPLRNERVVIAVDGKPKRSRHLRRLTNIEEDPRVSLLVQHDDPDWAELWWVRADGIAAIRPTVELDVERLHRQRYPQLAGHVLGPWIEIVVESISGWSAV